MINKLKELFEDPVNFFWSVIGALLVLLVALLVFGTSAKASEPDNVIAISEVSTGRDGSRIQFILTAIQFPEKCKNGFVAVGTTRRGVNEADEMHAGCWAVSDKGIMFWEFNGSPADSVVIPRARFYPPGKPAARGTSI